MSIDSQIIRVTAPQKERTYLWAFFVIFSLALHIGFFIFAEEWAESTPRTPYEPSQMAFRTVAPPPAPLLEQEPEKAVLPIPEMKPEIKVPKKSRPKTPKPNTATPPPAKVEAQPAKPVFGVTADSVTPSGSGVAVRVGNTLAKAMEQELTNPKDVAALPPAPKSPLGDQAVPKKKSIKPVPVYELSKAPTFKKKVEPKYPDQARRQGIEGTVQLEILIDENGRVRKVKVLKSPGHGLERAAIAALSKSKFNPGVINGKAVPVKIKIPYRFVLDA